MKMCSECGCVMKETDTSCPNCGHKEDDILEIPKENHRNSLDVESQFEEKEPKREIQESPFLTAIESNPFEGLPVVNNKHEISEEQEDYNPFYMQNKTPEPRYYPPVNTNIINEKKESSISPKAIIATVLIIIIALGCFLAPKIFKDKEKKADPISIPQIKLSEIEDSKNDKDNNEQPENPNQDPEENPNGNEENPPVEDPSNIVKKQVGEFILSIPNNYNIGNYEDMGITVVEPTTGATITFIQGVADIKTYRSQQDNLVEQMEQGGTTVGRIYNTVMNNLDTQVMELSQEDVSYIMLIVAVKKGKTLLIMVADQSKPHEFNYDIISDAISIASSATTAGI